MMLFHYEVPYEIIGITNLYPKQAITNETIYPVGNRGCRSQYQCILRFNFNMIPKEIHVARAELTFTTLYGALAMVRAYPITGIWKKENVSWMNPPLYDRNQEIIKSYMEENSTYHFDVTSLVNQWIQAPSSNLGLILLASSSNMLSYVDLITCYNGVNKLSLAIDYCEDIVPVKPTTYQYVESIVVNGAKEYFSTTRDVSLSSRSAYFICNDTGGVVTANIEYSPNQQKYYKEMQSVDIEPGATKLITPIHYSRYMRLALSVSTDGVVGNISICLDVQEASAVFRNE